jgi:hypothetical protein
MLYAFPDSAEIPQKDIGNSHSLIVLFMRETAPKRTAAIAFLREKYMYVH